MSAIRNTAIADLDLQIQQAAALQAQNQQGTPVGYAGGQTGVAGVRGASTVKVNDRTVSSYPTERLFESGEPTLKLIQPNPYVDVPLLPLVPGETAPPPPNAARDAQRRAQQQQRTNVNDTRQIMRGISGGFRAVNLALRQQGQQLNRRLGGIATPGDVWTPFFILLALFLIMIPVNGHSRLLWLWLVILGGAHVSTPYASQQQVFEGAAGATGNNSTNFYGPISSGGVSGNGSGGTNLGGTNLGGGITGTIISPPSQPSAGSNNGIGVPGLPINRNYMSLINASVGELV